jgi:hypothetical protein
MRMVCWRLTLPLLRRMFPFERLVRLTATHRSKRPDPREVEAVVTIGGRLWRDSSAPCLERSVCIHRQLGRVGAEPQLVLGLATDRTGHAWVEIDRQPVLEPTSPHLRYQELLRFDAAGTLLTSDAALQNEIA